MSSQRRFSIFSLIVPILLTLILALVFSCGEQPTAIEQEPEGGGDLTGVTWLPQEGQNVAPLGIEPPHCGQNMIFSFLRVYTYPTNCFKLNSYGNYRS